jgi:GntR family transcriptional regulator, transcriptional repressor for pyruvate dehydrogenase complex
VRTRLRPLGRVPLVDTVTQHLRSLIIQGELQAGDRLPSEAELIKQLRVSRPVLREAVNRLAAVGLLSVRHGSGTFVARREWLASCTKLAGSAMAIEPKELLQFVEFRRVLESYAARRAAKAAQPEQVAALDRTLEEALGAAGRGSRRAMQADFRFHCMLVEIGGNRLMRSLLELLQEFIMVSMIRTQPPSLSDPESASIHRAIVQAIRDRSPQAAEHAVHAHMDLVASRLQAAPAGEKATRTLRPRRRKAGCGVPSR